MLLWRDVPSNAVNVSLDGVDNDGEAGEGDNCGGVFTGNVPDRAAGNNEGQPQSAQNVENINGGSGADQLVGNAAGNLINGNEGNDALTGGGSTDT
jgi:serralysin